MPREKDLIFLLLIGEVAYEAVYFVLREHLHLNRDPHLSQRNESLSVIFLPSTTLRAEGASHGQPIHV